MIGFIPRDNIIQEAEANKKTVIEYNPNSELSDIYKSLAIKIENNVNFVIPKPMKEQELENFYFSNM
jgi:nitrogenase iron protein NifH